MKNLIIIALVLSVMGCSNPNVNDSPVNDATVQNESTDTIDDALVNARADEYFEQEAALT